MFGAAAILITFGAVARIWPAEAASTAEPGTGVIPYPRHGMAMTADPSGGVMMFGGNSPSPFLGSFHQLYWNDTWLWQGGSWTQAFPTTSPHAREEMGMAYDAKRHEVVMFGGVSPSNPISFFHQVFWNDTWVWDGANWTQAFPKTSPPPREDMVMSYDAATGTVVMFGGWSKSHSWFGDTWIWDGRDWQETTSSTRPVKRADAGMSDEPAMDGVVLFGGWNSGDDAFGDTWLLTGSSWRQLSPATSATPRGDMCMAYDPALGGVLMFGGSPTPTLRGFPLQSLGDTWLLTGTGWVQASPEVSPPTRLECSMAFDRKDGVMVMFGGLVGGRISVNDTWTYDGTIWTQA